MKDSEAEGQMVSVSDDGWINQIATTASKMAGYAFPGTADVIHELIDTPK